MIDQGVSCPRHPDSDVGVSEEHVFCLTYGCSWEDELCWDSYSHNRDPPLLCARLSGHEGEHVALTERGVAVSWPKFGSIPTNKCSSCGDEVPLGRTKCEGCENRLLQHVLLGKDTGSNSSSARCVDCGVDMMGQLGKLCKACRKSPRQLCVRCGVRSYGPKYCVKCEAVVTTGSAPKP